MVAFRYKAVGAEGKPVGGTIEASDRRAALNELSGQGLFPSQLEVVDVASVAAAPPPNSTEVSGPNRPVDASRATDARRSMSPGSMSPESMPPAKMSPEKRPRESQSPRDSAYRPDGSIRADIDPQARQRGKGVKRKEVTAFTRQISTLLAATIPIPTALSGLAEQEQNEAFRGVLADLSERVRRGEPLSAAMSEYPRLFPPLYSSMVEVGEESGQLDGVLNDLADYLEDQDEIRGEIMGAIAYPAFVLGFGIITTIILLTFIMPRLLTMLEGMGDALPLPTRILLAVSNVFQAYWPWILGGTIGSIFVGYRYIQTAEGRYQWDRWRLRWPVLGGLFTCAALARFSRTLGTLHRAGVGLVRALDIVRNTVGNDYLAARVAEVAEETKGGESLATPIRQLDLFPPTMVQMISVGEETGRLDEMLLRVAVIQNKQVRGHASTLVSLLGPILILLVGAAVGFIVISLLLPIFQISQGMK